MYLDKSTSQYIFRSTFSRKGSDLSGHFVQEEGSESRNIGYYRYISGSDAIFTGGDSIHCPRGSSRSGKVSFTESCAPGSDISSLSVVSVTETDLCYYVMQVTGLCCAPPTTLTSVSEQSTPSTSLSPKTTPPTIDVNKVKFLGYEEWFESQESGESSCGSINGEIIDTKCRLEWLNDANCPIFSTAGYFTGNNIVRYEADESPNGIQWMPEECAAECAKNEECEAWFTIGRCVLRTKEIFWSQPGYTTGLRNLNCDGVLNRCKTSCRSIMDAKLQEGLSSPTPQITPRCFDAYDGGKDGVLYNAVRSYVSQDCRSNKECSIGQTYGWPMNSWCVGNVTDMSELFHNMNTFNEDISDWNTSSVTSMNRM